MELASNSTLLAAAFIEGSAVFIILVLYALLAPSFPARFFRYWIAGWSVYLFGEAARIWALWSNARVAERLVPACAVGAAALFFIAALQCTGQWKKRLHLWPIAVVAASGIVVVGYVVKVPNAQAWSQCILESALYLLAGWILWRSQAQHRGFGWKLLAGALMLHGLHSLDQPQWAGQQLGLLRVPFQGLLGITVGIAMAVLVLEAGRSRMEDLNEKLRRLALIAAQATQSANIEDALNGVLAPLTQSLNMSHGLFFLFESPQDQAGVLALRASVGFSDAYCKQNARMSSRGAWAQNVLAQETPVVAYSGSEDPILRRWIGSEKLTALALVRVHGKDGPLGILMVGTDAPRSLESDEEHFLVNVANLLGLALQNLNLFETAATSRRQWRETFDSIDDLLLVHAPDGHVLRANRALCARLSVAPSKLVGSFLKDSLPHLPGKPWIRCPYCEDVAGRAETPDPFFGGYFLASDSALHDSAGNRTGTIHVLKDVTRRRAAEDKFRMLFEKVQEGIFIATPEGKFVDFNDAMMRILGFDDHEEMLSVDISSTMYADPEDRSRRMRLLNEYGEIRDFEFRLRRRNGDIRIVQESSFVTRDAVGAIVAHQGFVLDITDRKDAEMEIRRRNRELLALNAVAELLAQSSGFAEVLTGALQKIAELFAVDTCAIFVLDPSARALRLAAATGCRSSYATQNRAIDMAPELVQQIRQARATLLSGAVPSLPEGFRELQRAEGIVSAQFAVLRAKDRIAGFLMIGCRESCEFAPGDLNLLSAVGNQIALTMDKSLLLDQTREAYDSLRRTQEQLLQSEKMAAVGQLISGVAHELNNPLTAILGYSQLLKTEADLSGERGAAYVNKLYKQAQRTHHIVQNLLSFARQRKPERQSVDLNQILEDTIALREYDLRLNNIHVHREFDSKLPTTGGDFHQLQQVFLNILNNAVDAIQEKKEPGDIWIRTSANQDRLRVEITDSGPGVQNPHRIFDPFYTTKEVGKGTGLGLSICYGIVKEHGGEISVKNVPPRGAMFTIVLPQLILSPGAREASPLVSAAQLTGAVLLVDDEEAILALEEEILSAEGLFVKVARDVREALKMLKTSSFDAIVSDMKMPGDLTTMDLFIWVERHHPELASHIIFTASGERDAAFSEMIHRAGCTVLSKPFQIQDFSKAVQDALRAAQSKPVPAGRRR